LIVRTRIPGLVVLLGVIASGPGVAQTSSSGKSIAYTAGVGGTYGNLVGGHFSGSKAAVGFDVNAGVVLGRWQLGLGYDRTNHGHEDTDGDYVVSNVYLEPRLLFAGARPWTPYAALRLGRAMASFEGVVGITDKATGYIAGLGGGVMWSMTRSVQADAGAHYARLSHDYGTGGYADAEKGGRLNARIGLRANLAR
jgi:hypothetical protein